MRARYFEYMVSYSFGSSKGKGNGSIILKFNRKINGHLLRKTKDLIEIENKFQNVFIQNYQLLREYKS